MNIENLDRLIDRLSTISDKTFNMSSWLDTNLEYCHTHDSEDNDQRNLIHRLYGITGSDFMGNPDYYRDAIVEHTCGTVGCIAGHVLIMATIDGTVTSNVSDTYRDDVAQYAGDWLGISAASRERLFIPSRYSVLYSLVKPKHAVAVLMHLRDTGYVDWRVAPEVLQRNADEYFAIAAAESRRRYLAGPSELSR